MLICISAGEGSWHFSPFHYYMSLDIPVATINDSIIYRPPVDFVMDDFIEHKNKVDKWDQPFLLYSQWRIPHVS